MKAISILGAALLILDEAKRHPTPGLTNFISQYALEAYKPLTNLPASNEQIRELLSKR